MRVEDCETFPLNGITNDLEPGDGALVVIARALDAPESIVWSLALAP